VSSRVRQLSPGECWISAAQPGEGGDDFYIARGRRFADLLSPLGVGII